MKRRRTFGGREGVWFRCKRSSANSHAEKSGRPVDRSTGDASTVAVSSDDDDNLSCTSCQENNDVPSQQGEVIRVVEEQQEIESSQSSTGFTPKEQQHRKRARRAAFGSRKPSNQVKEDHLFSDLSAMPRMRTMATSIRHSQLSAASKDDDEDNAASSLAPPSQQHSFLQSQDSSSKGSLHSKETDNADGGSARQQAAPISNEKSVFDFDISPQESSSQTTAANKKIVINNNHKNNINVNIHTPKSSLRQPTALTTLSVARAYFARLDASSPLTHTTRKSPTKKAVVRTTRRRTTRNNPELAKEFNKYRQMCQEAGVSPMLLEGYIQQRENFVSRNRLYDGFLDE